MLYCNKYILKVTMSEKKSYVLYGASFNPPHQGHFSAITQMLENFDYIIIFLYPKKHSNVSGEVELLPPLKQREKMLDLFIKEHFPQPDIQNKIIVTNLAEAIQSQKNSEIIHTYDYLQYVKENLPSYAELSVCMSFNEKNQNRTEKFFNEDKIKNEFGVFYLTEENNIQSSVLREFFSNNKSVKSVKDMNYIKYAVGNNLADYIFKNNLYGLKDKLKKPKVEKNKTAEETIADDGIISNQESLTTKKRLKR